MGLGVRVVGQPSIEELHAEHGPRIRRLCRLLLRDASEAEDAAQEVLVRLLKVRKAGHVHETWDRWLTRVAVNVCRDRRRSRWWGWWRNEREEFREDHVPVRVVTPEEALLGVEARHRIWAAFRQLSARQQEVFALRHVEGFSTAEVATMLDLSEGSAKRHLFRAVHRLREALGGVR
jgi:RNA polymerase sigma-70 factor (ECF subfamily)